MQNLHVLKFDMGQMPIVFAITTRGSDVRLLKNEVEDALILCARAGCWFSNAIKCTRSDRSIDVHQDEC